MFSKDINRCCAHCRHSKILKFREGSICMKKKLNTDLDSVCRSYIYDPLKRKPPVREEKATL